MNIIKIAAAAFALAAASPLVIDAHHPGRSWNGTLNLYIDNARTAALDAADNPLPEGDITLIESIEIPSAILQKLSTARATIAASIDGWGNAMVFPARGTDAALAALTMACAR